VKPAGELLDPAGAEGAVERGDPGVAGAVLVGDGCQIDPAARLDGPLVIGDGCVVEAGARVKHSVLLPGSRVSEGAIVAGAILGSTGRLR
jgi:NDP-sugar pyrophosphorylase family protein